MTFTDGYRVERVYFERLKSLITILKSLKDGVEDETVRSLIENAIDSDGAILLLYRNLGEAWAELADQVQKTRKMLQDLDEKTEKYHDELNERIDEVNNYLMALIRALEARMDAVEADLAQMGRLFTYDLQRVNDEYTLTESGQPVTWDGPVEKVQHVRPHFVTVRGSLDGEVTYLMPREYDTAQASGVFEWYSVGFVGNEIHEVTVTLLSDDSVNVVIHTTDFAAILQRITNLETRMTTAEGDIDNLETRMSTAETDIDNLETEMDGKQDVLTPGNGILLSNNVISADTDLLQEKLVAGTGITINPTTHEISSAGVSYTAGKAIDLSQNIITNNSGVLNMGNLTTLIRVTDVVGSFATNPNIGDLAFYKAISKNISTYNGLFYWIENHLPCDRNLASEGVWASQLASFDPDCKVLLSVKLSLQSISFDNYPTSSTNIIYFRDELRTMYDLANGDFADKLPIKYNSSSGTLNAVMEHASKVNYIRIGKPSTPLYICCLVSILPLKTTKTASEWLTFINSNWGSAANSPITALVVYGTSV